MAQKVGRREFYPLFPPLFKIAASRFVNVSEEEIHLMKENAIPRNNKHATKFGMTLFKGKM